MAKSSDMNPGYLRWCREQITLALRVRSKLRAELGPARLTKLTSDQVKEKAAKARAEILHAEAERDENV